MNKPTKKQVNPVAPLEHIEEEVPVEVETSEGPVLVEEVIEKPTANGCWNCKNHGKISILNSENKCDVCGFDKDALFNLDLEAEKATKRQEAANATN